MQCSVGGGVVTGLGIEEDILMKERECRGITKANIDYSMIEKMEMN